MSNELASTHPHSPDLLRPVVSPADLIALQSEKTLLIQQALKSGQDYGVIPGTGDRPTLLKPGAERLCTAFNVTPIYEIVEKEVDHDRQNTITVNRWVDAQKPSDEEIEALKASGRGRFSKKDNKWTWQEKSTESGTSYGLYRFVIRCLIQSRCRTKTYGEGIGSCSTMETKYIRSPRDAENTVLKMAQKRALIAATLNAFGLSDRFTQDAEDMVEAPAPVATPEPAPPVQEGVIVPEPEEGAGAPQADPPKPAKPSSMKDDEPKTGPIYAGVQCRRWPDNTEFEVPVGSHQVKALNVRRAENPHVIATDFEILEQLLAERPELIPDKTLPPSKWSMGAVKLLIDWFLQNAGGPSGAK